MIDLTAAGNRGLETLDSVQDAQNSLHLAHMQQDFIKIQAKLAKTAKAMGIVDKYFASNPKPIPKTETPALNRQTLEFPTTVHYQPTMAAKLFKPADTRILTASVFPSGNSFI